MAGKGGTKSAGKEKSWHGSEVKSICILTVMGTGNICVTNTVCDTVTWGAGSEGRKCRKEKIVKASASRIIRGNV